VHFAVAVDHLNELQIRAVCKQSCQTGIASTRSGEDRRNLQFHNRYAQGGGMSDAAVAGTRVHVNLLCDRANRGQAADETFAFVSSDYDQAHIVGYPMFHHLRCRINGSPWCKPILDDQCTLTLLILSAEYDNEMSMTGLFPPSKLMQ
jgi:hypothetical protein